MISNYDNEKSTSQGAFYRSNAEQFAHIGLIIRKNVSLSFQQNSVTLVNFNNILVI